MNNLYGWIVASDVGEKYLQKCQLFSENEEAFSNFRRDVDYTKILEGGQRVVGELHLDRIMNRGNIKFLLDNAKVFKENDKYGNPVLLDFGIINNINPCTLLYISHLCDIRVILKDFQPKKIVEIGGGFGGFCKIFSSIYNFDEYIMIDLPEAIALAKKYLIHFPSIYSKISFIDTYELSYLDPVNIKGIDLFVASASLAELEEDAQNYYVDNFLLKSKFAYIIYNTIEISGDIYLNLFIKMLEHFKVLAERFNDVDVLLLEKK